MSRMFKSLKTLKALKAQNPQKTQNAPNMPNRIAIKKRLRSSLAAILALTMIFASLPIGAQAATEPIVENKNDNWLIYSIGRGSYVQHLENASYGANPGGVVATQDDPEDPAAQWTLQSYDSASVPAAAGFFRFTTAAEANGHAANMPLKFYDAAVYVEGGANGNADGITLKPGAAPGSSVIRGGGGNPTYPQAANATGVTINADAALRRNAASNLDEFIIIPPVGYVPTAPAPSKLTTPDGVSVVVEWPIPTTYASKYALWRSDSGDFAAEAVEVDISGATYEAGYVMRVVDASPKEAGKTYYYRFLAEDYWHTAENAAVGETTEITMPSTLPPTVLTAGLSFFKEPAPKDQTIAFDPGFGDPDGAAAVAGVSITRDLADPSAQPIALTPGDGYTVDWNARTVTIKKGALAELAEGAYRVDVAFGRPAGELAFGVELRVYDSLKHGTDWLVFSPDIGAIVGLRANNPFQTNDNTLQASFDSAESESARWTIRTDSQYNADYPYQFVTSAAPGTNRMSIYGDFWGAWTGDAPSGATAMQLYRQGDGSVKMRSAWTWAALKADGTSGTAGDEAAASKLIVVPPDSYAPGDPVDATITSEAVTNVKMTWKAPREPEPNYFAGFRVFRLDGDDWVELTADDNLVVAAADGVYSFEDNEPIANESVYRIVTDTANNDSAGARVTANIVGTEPPDVKTDKIAYNDQNPGSKTVDVYFGFGDASAKGVVGVKNGDYELTAGADYAFAGRVLTINESYLDTLPSGDYALDIVFDDASALSDTVALSVSAYAPGVLTPIASFNKKNPQAVILNATLGFGVQKAAEAKAVLLDGEPIAYAAGASGTSVSIAAADLLARELLNGDGHLISVAFDDAAETVSKIPLNVLNASEALAPPAGVAVTGDGNGATISWDAVENASGYKIYRGLGSYAPDSFTTLAAVVADGSLSYDLGVDHAWDWYKVAAYDSDGNYMDGAASDVASLEITTFPNTEIFTEDDSPATVDELTEFYEKLFFWGGAIGGGSPAGARADNQFTDDRVALLFRPAKGHAADFDYLSMYLNFYMHIAGLGKVPTDVRANAVQVMSWEGGSYNGGGNVTQNFWRTFENLETLQAGNAFGVSQASPIRRVKTGGMAFQIGGSASGGFIADSYTGWLAFQGQQQFYMRNNAISGTDGLIWNGVTQGNTNQAGTEWNQSYSGIVVDIETTPVIAEKPFLYFDVEANGGTGDYKVFVPGLRENAAGLSWGDGKDNGGMGVGESRKLSEFFVADESMSAQEIIDGMNAKNGNIFFTPGVYKLDREIVVTQPDAVLLGIGEASLRPTKANVCVRVANVPGVRVAGLLFDAGPAPDNDFEKAGEALLVVGDGDKFVDAAAMKANPIILSDVIARVGGVDTAEPCMAKNAVVLNADYTILDHAWIWRADHGDQVGWSLNRTDNGLVVNGDYVTTYGLHSEHYQKYDVLWNGDNGRCFFLQNERPYDTPDTEDVPGAWRDTSLQDPKYDYLGSLEDRQQGYAAFRVGDGVKNFEGWGLVSYDVFVQNMSVPFRRVWSAFITPQENANIKIHQVGTLSISSAKGEIAHVINGLGDATPPNLWQTTLMPGNEYASSGMSATPDAYALTGATLSPNLDAISLRFLNPSETEKVADVYVAGYDAAGRMIGLRTGRLTAPGSVYFEGGAGGVGGDSQIVDNASNLSYDDYTVTLNGALPDSGAGAATYKAFLWEPSTFAPITDAARMRAN